MEKYLCYVLQDIHCLLYETYQDYKFWVVVPFSNHIKIDNKGGLLPSVRKSFNKKRFDWYGKLSSIQYATCIIKKGSIVEVYKKKEKWNIKPIITDESPEYYLVKGLLKKINNFRDYLPISQEEETTKKTYQYKEIVEYVETPKHNDRFFIVKEGCEPKWQKFKN